MSEKNLDKLFKEKFTNFSEVPDDRVWKRIATSLDNTKTKRSAAIPIWWKLGGMAAVLAVLLYAINPFETVPKVTPTVTDIEKTEQNREQLPLDEDKNFKLPQKEESVIADTEDVDVPNDSNVEQSGKENTTRPNNFNRGVHEIVEKDVTTDGDKSLDRNKSVVKETGVAENETQNKLVDKNKQDSRSKQKEHTDIAEINDEAVAISDSGAKTKASTNNSGTMEQKKKEAVEKSIHDNLDTSTKDDVAKVDEPAKEILEKKKKSIYDEIVAQEEEKMEIAQNSNKWSVGANVAPVYFNAIGEGSPIHSIFVPNSKSGDVNLSYGVSVAYEINKKLSIRSGINKVDYGYNTDEVAFSSEFGLTEGLTVNDGQIDNINYSAPAVNLVVQSKAGNMANRASSDAFNNEFIDASAERNGVMAQQFGYLEVPVELNYALIDKKFGLNLVGGVSSLFLVDNSVAVTSGELTTELGEANNLNSVNFSTNIGFGVNYKFSPKVRLNLEPIFKYQLNTFSNTAGEFRPFSVGVFSGLSFRF